MLFIRDHFGSYTRPIKELKGFARYRLKAGESTSVNFVLSSNDLKFWTKNQ
jgi:beta-glucosidase